MVNISLCHIFSLNQCFLEFCTWNVKVTHKKLPIKRHLTWNRSLFEVYYIQGHVIYCWKGCLKLIKIHIRKRVSESSGEVIYAIFYCRVTKITDSLSFVVILMDLLSV